MSDTPGEILFLLLVMQFSLMEDHQVLYNVATFRYFDNFIGHTYMAFSHVSNKLPTTINGTEVVCIKRKTSFIFLR